MVQALVTSFEEASRLTYKDPAFRQEGGAARVSRLARRGGRRGDRRRAAVLIPAQSVVTQADQWKNLMDMQIYLGNVKGSHPADPRSSTIPSPRRRSSSSAAERQMLQQVAVAGGLAGGGAFRPAAGRRRRAQGLRRWLARRCRSSPTCPSRLEAGTIVSIVGPSGCGKTTLLNVLSGLIPPSSAARSAGTASHCGACRPRSATCCRRISCSRGGRRSPT